jgi:hypothetical protein
MTARKKRPRRGDQLAANSSSRDIAAALGFSRARQWRAKLIAEIPNDTFEALIEGDNPPTVTELSNMAQGRAGLKRARRRQCPHCGGSL